MSGVSRVAREARNGKCVRLDGVVIPHLLNLVCFYDAGCVLKQLQAAR